MRSRRRSLGVAAVGLGLGAAGLAGCQTTPAGFGGLTLPSPHYLQHYPQYFPPEPAFPLQRELDSQQDPNGLGRFGPGAANPLGGAGVVPPPAPVAAPPAAGVVGAGPNGGAVGGGGR